jgi:hypothetical protein
MRVRSAARLRSGVAAGWLAGLLSFPAGGAPQSDAQRACFAAVQRGFGGVAAAAQADAETCLRDAAGGALGGLALAECAAADRDGAVALALASALAGEAAACEAGSLPEFGSAGAAAAGEAAKRAAESLLGGLLGPAPAAAPASEGAAARCQASLLRASGRCSAAYSRAYARCAERALAKGADDAFDLVACKGTDPGACRGGLRAAARACRGQDAAALFPGCAGDLADCARAHARRSASLAQNAAGALCEDVLPGSRDPETLLRCFEPPAREPVESALVPLPEGVVPESPGWEPSGEFIEFSFRSPDVPGIELGRIRPDGSGFACLSCGAGIVPPVRSIRPFEDGARLLVNSGNGAAPSWRVLECEPGLADCQSSLILPIELPANPDPSSPTLQYRVPHVTRDGAYFVWTEIRQRGPGNFVALLGRLDREPDRYVVRDARVIAPALQTLALGDDAELWQRLTANYEAKGAQLRGGLDYVIAGTPQAGHYDDFVVELETGATRRLSRHPDHDEGIELSPDERWMVTASARGNQRLEFLGLLPRPPFIDGIAFALHFTAIAGQPGDGSGNPGGDPRERDCYLEPWLLDAYGERGEYLGQELAVPGSDGFEPSPGVAWHPDGTRILLMETRWKRLTPQGERPESRLRLLRLSARRPLAPAEVVPAAPTPEPLWAIRYEDWIVPDLSGVTVIPGKVSGTATLSYVFPNPLSGEVAVRYDGYSDDGRSVLDGFERVAVPFLLAGADYEVDLRLRGKGRGAASGAMRGALQYDFANDVNTGRVTSRLAARRLAGPRTCEAAGLLP